MPSFINFGQRNYCALKYSVFPVENVSTYFHSENQKNMSFGQRAQTFAYNSELRSLNQLFQRS